MSLLGNACQQIQPVARLRDQDQSPHLHHPFPLLSSSSFVLLFFLYIACSFLLHAFSLDSLLHLFCLLWVMPDNDLSCKLPRQFMCVCALVYFLHPTPPTISADHLLAAFFLLPLFVSSFSFGILPLQQAEKTFFRMSYVICVRIAVAPRYHV